jgi:hypothetical protein
MNEQTPVLSEDPPFLSTPSPDRAHRIPGVQTASSGMHDLVATVRVVVEAECGILVYPPEAEGEPWRATFTENGRRRFRQAQTEAELAAKLAKVTERLRAGAPGMERPGADLIAHYLDPDRLPVSKRWSRRHADTQRRLCRRFAAPVIAAVTCQDITTGHMQQIVNSAPTASEGDRPHRCLSAMVTAGIKGGYLTSPRLQDGKCTGRPPAGQCPSRRPAYPGNRRCGSTWPRSRPGPGSVRARLELRFAVLLDQFRTARALADVLRAEPAMFAEIAATAYLPDHQSREDTEISPARANLSILGITALSSWRTPPGIRADRTADARYLRAWVLETCQHLARTGHTGTGDRKDRRPTGPCASGGGPHLAARTGQGPDRGTGITRSGSRPCRREDPHGPAVPGTRPRCGSPPCGSSPVDT